jgi:DmsE family decaheme c-type cytochrome
MRTRSALVALALGLAGWAGTAGASEPSGPSAKCMMCHQVHHASMARTPHAVTADPRNAGCIGCHGLSSRHAEDPSVRPDQVYKGEGALSPELSSAVCLNCHDKNAQLTLWATSRHPQADVACTGCHEIHANQPRVLGKRTQAGVCYTCHQAQRALVDRPSRHPIAEGKMTCSSCHNVHGSAGPKLVRRDSTNDTCYLCHAEKRGPFVHAHAPVTEDCGICHNPHGSNVAGMLNVRMPILCNQCHTPHVAGGVGALRGQPGVLAPAVPPQTSSAVGPTSSGINVINIWQGRSCMNCHTQVHGSNNPSLSSPTPGYLFR